jgi:tetratricopeptide (TPR) repeat protein
MKNFIFSAGVLFSLISILFPARNITPDDKTAIRQYLEKKKRFSISCAPDRNNPGLLPENPADMVPLPGWGSYSWGIKTSSDSAGYYFSQGINMYYSFHIIESLASFSKAAHLDPGSPMPWWGMALAYGPNINDITYTATPKAIEAIHKSDSLSSVCTLFEKGLIRAMKLRYSADTSKKRKALDSAYAKAMKELYDKHPDNADAGALYADALMLLHPWDLYDQKQKPRPWTPELVTVLEKTLRLNPAHPAANHYYIHAVEASLKPERALASADKLGNLLPAVSHMVHMPSHIYIRTGMYEKGRQVNQKAIEGYYRYNALFPAVENGIFLYVFHNQHMQATCAIMNGDFEDAVNTSRLLKEQIPADYLGSAPPEAEYLQYMYMTELFSYVRYGKWEKILQLAQVPDSHSYANILLEFGRGISFARLKKFDEARLSLQKMEQRLRDDKKLKIRMGAFNTAFAGGEIAVAIVQGIIAEEENRLDKAIEWLSAAVKLEDQMIYDEPKDWLLPPRHYLASVLIKKGQFSEAADVLKKDLSFNPDNGWALTGLWVALQKQGKNKEAAEVKKSLDAIGIGKDFPKTGPVF